MRAALFLLSHFEENLLKMGAEELMHSLGEMTKGEDFNDEAVILKFKERLKKFKLGEGLMEKLKEEEENIYRVSEKHIFVKPKTEAEVSLYFKSKDKYYAVDFT